MPDHAREAAADLEKTYRDSLAFAVAEWNKENHTNPACVFHGEEQRRVQGPGEARRLYRQIAEKYKRMTDLIPFSGANGVGASVDRTMLPEVLGLARECKDLEEQAMSLIGEALD